jgi:hypothetical protein
MALAQDRESGAVIDRGTSAEVFFRKLLRDAGRSTKQRVPFSPRSGVNNANRGSGDGL